VGAWRFGEGSGILRYHRTLIQLARQQVRQLHRVPNSPDYRYPDAFYQVALDCGCEEWDARAVRQAVMVVNQKR
jgi:hypothetical protein